MRACGYVYTFETMFKLTKQVHRHIHVHVVKINACADAQICMWFFFYVCTWVHVLKGVTLKLRFIGFFLYVSGKG